MNWKKPTSQSTWTLIIGSLCGLFVTALLAKRGTLLWGEAEVLQFFYDVPEGLRMFFVVTTMLGSIWVVAIILCGLLIRERFDIALRVLIVTGLVYVVSIAAKYFVGRVRPSFLIDITPRELFVVGNGFPSAHTALATGLAILLGAYMPVYKRKYIVPLWIGLVGVSRLYLGVHAPLDIIGGFCIGLLAVTSVLIVLPPGKQLRGIRVAKKRKQAYYK